MSLSTFGLNWTRAHDSWIRLIRSIHPSSLYTTTPDSFSQMTFSLKMTKEKQKVVLMRHKLAEDVLVEEKQQFLTRL